MEILNLIKYEKNFRAKREARKYKDDLISKSFYRFGYQHKICNVLNHTLKTHGKIARDEFVNEVLAYIPNYFVSSLVKLRVIKIFFEMAVRNR